MFRKQIYLNKNPKELPVNQSLKLLSVKGCKFLKKFQLKIVFSDQFFAIFLPSSANSHTAWPRLRSDSNQVHSTAVVHSESTSAQQNKINNVENIKKSRQIAALWKSWRGNGNSSGLQFTSQCVC